MAHESMSGEDGAARQPLVQLHNVSKRFRMQDAQRSWRDVFIHLSRRQRDPSAYFWPLRDITFDVRSGDAIGVLGPNG